PRDGALRRYAQRAHARRWWRVRLLIRRLLILRWLLVLWLVWRRRLLIRRRNEDGRIGWRKLFVHALRGRFRLRRARRFVRRRLCIWRGLWRLRHKLRRCAAHIVGRARLFDAARRAPHLVCLPHEVRVERVCIVLAAFL